jgi:hypothetical protein
MEICRFFDRSQDHTKLPFRTELNVGVVNHAYTRPLVQQHIVVHFLKLAIENVRAISGEDSKASSKRPSPIGTFVPALRAGFSVGVLASFLV